MNSPKRLHRQSASRRIAGVCAGIAEYLDADVTLVRLTWVVFSIIPGGLVGGVVAYLAAWMIVPDGPAAPADATPPRRLTRSVTQRKVAGVCGGLAEHFGIDPTFVRLLWAVLTIVPGVIVLGVLAYLVAWFIMPVNQVTQVHAPSPTTG